MNSKSKTKSVKKVTTKKTAKTKTVQKVTTKSPKTLKKSKVKKSIVHKKNINKKTTGTKTKKSILSLPKKKQRMFGIYVILSKEDIRFFRFRSVLTDDNKIEYHYEFVTKLDDCSRFVNMDSAKKLAASLSTKIKSVSFKAFEINK